MAFWQYPWHITVARLRRTSTGFPCSACSPQATKPICSFQAKEKATQADLCQCDRMFSHPAFLHPISGMRSGFSHGRYSGSAHLRGESLLRLYPAFSGFPNDRLPPTGRTSRHLQHRFVRGLSPHSLFKLQSRPAHLGATRT